MSTLRHGFWALASMLTLATPCFALNQAPTANLTAPSAGMKYYAPATIDLAADASDPDGTVAKVEFYSNATLIPNSADTTGPSYTFRWTNVPAGTYTLKARAYDNLGKTGDSPTVQITVVQITTVISSPAANAVIGGRTTSVSGTIVGPDNSTVIVTAGGGHSVVATLSSGAFTADGVELIPGLNTIEVGVARQDGTSEVATRSVTAVAPPVVAIVGPQSCSIYTTTATITLTSDAASAQGTISAVEYFEGSTSLGRATAAPYSVTYTFTGIGTHSVVARATDSFGFTGDSAPMVFAIRSQPPTVSIMSPVSGSTFGTPANITFTATASDPDGSVSYVQYKAVKGSNETYIGSYATPPYTVTWQNPPVGTYDVIATAIDNNNTPGQSAPIQITVSDNPPPTVVLTAPTESTPLRAPATISFAANASDVSPGTVTMVEFLLDGQVVATDTTAPYTGTKTGVAAGPHDVAARATDNQGATNTHTIRITVAANALPTVNITDPLEGAIVSAPADVTVTATANDSDGTIAKVEFFDGPTLIGTATTTPYSVVLHNPTVGQHSLTAKATDNEGGTNVSNTRTFTVNGVSSSITSPANGSNYVAPAAYDVKATISTSSGVVTSVEWYDGPTKVSTQTVPPPGVPTVNSTLNLTAVAAGTHVYTAKGFDSGGRNATSTAVTVNVAPAPTPPTVSLTSPPNNAFYIAPAIIKLSANVTQGANTVERVEFYAGTTLVGTATSTPYSVTWTNVPSGPYAMTAKAIDTSGISGTTNQVSVTVASAPSVAAAPGLDGSTINSDSVLISGTTQTTANSSVAVNGQMAVLAADGRYFINSLPLVAGANNIAIQVMTQDGESSTQTITVTSSGTAPFKIGAYPTEGIAPFDAQMVVGSVTGAPFGSVEFDFNDDGVADYTATSLEAAQVTLTGLSAGMHRIRATVKDAQGGTIYTTVLLLYGADPVARFDKLKGVFDDMLGRLTAGDINRAMNIITPTVNAKYRGVFEALGADLATAVPQLGTLVNAEFGDNTAHLYLVRGSGPSATGFFIYLIRGEDGIWRIDAM